MRLAHVIYISPKMLTARNAWCMSDVAGQPAIRRLWHRLRSAFGECHILCHEETTARLLSDASGAGVEVSARPSRFPALADFARRHDLDTLAVYPDTTIFPDCEGTEIMIARHQESGAAMTLADRYPLGLYPEIASRAALDRFENAEPAQTLRNLTERLNRPSWDQPVLRVDDYAGPQSPAEVLEAVGASALLWSGYAVEAASEVALEFGSEPPPGLAPAYSLGGRLRRPLKGQPARAQGPRLRVVYASLASYFAGAEESFQLLASNVDREHHEPVALLLRPSMLSERLSQAGVPVTVAPCDFGRLTPDAFEFLHQFLADVKPDLVHIDSFTISPLTLAARTAGIPVVQHVRVLPGRFASDVFQLADRTIAISEACRLDLLRSGLRPERIARIYNGLDLRRFRPDRFDRNRLRAEYGIEQDAFVISTVARICEQKRQHYLISALSRLAQKIPSCRLVIAGENHPNHAAYLDRLRRFIKDHGLERNILFTGFEPEVERIYALSDVSVLCSMGEAFGRCLIESMAMGVPVVAAADGGIPEIVTNGVDGLLFEPYSLNDLCSALDRVRMEPDFRDLLIRNGIARARQFPVSSYVQNVEKLYSSLIAERRAVRGIF